VPLYRTWVHDCIRISIEHARCCVACAHNLAAEQIAVLAALMLAAASAQFGAVAAVSSNHDAPPPSAAAAQSPLALYVHPEGDDDATSCC
jgi:hypothetical protein